MKKTHKTSSKKSFMQATYDMGKGAVVKHGITGLIALLVSSVVPMLQQWHQEKQVNDSIAAVGIEARQDNKDTEDRLNKQIDTVRTDDEKKMRDLWQAIADLQKTKEDKK